MFAESAEDGTGWRTELEQSIRDVTVLRIDDLPGANTDRNWPSGVLRRRVDDKRPDKEMVTLLRIGAAAKENGAPCESKAGHLEPLLVASALFRLCAGVSHPLFLGRPSAWLPFLPHVACKHFVTPFYEGPIQLDFGAVHWARDADGTNNNWPSRDAHAHLRAGSIVTIRVRPSDSQETVTDRSGASPPRRTTAAEADKHIKCVVLLTYVRVSSQFGGSEWKSEVMSGFGEPQQQAVGRFFETFPETPVPQLAVAELDDLYLGRFYGNFGVDDVIAHHAPNAEMAKETGTEPVTAPHIDPNPSSHKGAKATKVAAHGSRRIDNLLKRGYEMPAFVAWFAGVMNDIRSATSAQSLHSFYHDIAAGAGPLDSKQRERIKILMEARRAFNVPQPQPALSEESTEERASTVAAQVPGAAEAPSQRTPHLKRGRDPNSGGKNARGAQSVSPAAARASAAGDSAASARPTRAKVPKLAGGQPPAAVQAEQAAFALFVQLCDIDQDASRAPFASLLHFSPSGLINLLKGKKVKEKAAMEKAAWSKLQKEDAAAQGVLTAHARQAGAGTPDLEACCIQLAATRTGCRWRGAARPVAGHTFRQLEQKRSTLSLPQQQLHAQAAFSPSTGQTVAALQMQYPNLHLAGSAPEGSTPRARWGDLHLVGNPAPHAVALPPASAPPDPNLARQLGDLQKRLDAYEKENARLQKERDTQQMKLSTARQAPVSGTPRVAATARLPFNSAGNKQAKRDRGGNGRPTAAESAPSSGSGSTRADRLQARAIKQREESEEEDEEEEDRPAAKKAKAAAVSKQKFKAPGRAAAAADSTGAGALSSESAALMAVLKEHLAAERTVTQEQLQKLDDGQKERMEELIKHTDQKIKDSEDKAQQALETFRQYLAPILQPQLMPPAPAATALQPAKSHYPAAAPLGAHVLQAAASTMVAHVLDASGAPMEALHAQPQPATSIIHHMRAAPAASSYHAAAYRGVPYMHDPQPTYPSWPMPVTTYYHHR